MPDETTAVAAAREALWQLANFEWTGEGAAALDAFEAAIRAERESPQGRCKARVERPYGYSQCVLAEHSEDWAHIVTGDMELWMAEVWDNPGPTHLARRESPQDYIAQEHDWRWEQDSTMSTPDTKICRRCGSVVNAIKNPEDLRAIDARGCLPQRRERPIPPSGEVASLTQADALRAALEPIRSALVAEGGVEGSDIDAVLSYMEFRDWRALFAALSGAGVLHPETDSTEEAAR